MNETSWRRTVRHGLWIWLALMLLLGLTAASAWLRLGVWNGVVNFSIAAAKAALVGFFFMHLREAGSSVRLTCGIAVFVLALLFALSSADYRTRQTQAAPWQVPRVHQPAIHIGK